MDLSITRKQQAFIEAQADEVLLGGAAGGGKSYGQLIDAFLKALKYPGMRQLILRRTFPELQRSLVTVSLQLYPKEVARYNDSKHIWKFKNGSIIEFGYCESEKDVTRYQSAEYDIIRFDELTHFTEFQYTYLISRVRGANDFPKQLKSTTNPGSVGHGWVKARFIDRCQPNEVYIDDLGRTYLFIPAKVQDNKFLMASDPGYVRRLEQLPDEQRRALLDGDWDVFAGQYFREFRREKHVIDPFEIPPYWKRFRSIDWGYTDPCAVYWHAVGPDSRIYTYRELYITQTNASDVAKKIAAMSQGEDIAYTVMSPDAWAKRGNDAVHGESIAETFIRNGVPVIRADSDRINGWQRMREYMADAPDGKPYWQIFSTCQNLIRTLPTLVHDEHRVEDVSDRCEDHAAESCRYALMSRPSPAGARLGIAPDDWVPARAIQPGTVASLLDRLRRQKEEEEEMRLWMR